MKAVSVAVVAIILAGCTNGKDGPGTSSSATQSTAEALTDTRVERITRVTSEPVDDPELDTGTTTVTAGTVKAIAPAGHKVSIEVDERDAQSTSNRTNDSTATRTVLDEARKTPVAVYIGGAILVAAGAVVAIAFGRILWGLALAAAGAGGVAMVVAINVYPWAALIAVLLGAGAAGFVLFELWQTKRKDDALRNMVGGIDRLDKNTKERVVAEIGDKHKTGEKTRARTKAVVGKVKRDLGIG